MLHGCFLDNTADLSKGHAYIQHRSPRFPLTSLSSRLAPPESSVTSCHIAESIICPRHVSDDLALLKGPSKHAGADSEVFWLKPLTAIKASVQPESGRIVYAGSAFPYLIRFHSSKEIQDHIVQNRSGSDQDGLARSWPTGCGPEAGRCAGITGFGSGRTQPAHYQLPTFRHGYILPQHS